MAKYTIVHSCGHSETVELFGKETARAERIAWLEKKPCAACAAKEAEENAVANGLPLLKGSPKQIAWASTIRDEKISQIKKAEEFFQAHRDAEKAQAILPKCFAKIKEIKAEQSAKWWIDQRMDNFTSEDIFNIIRKEERAFNIDQEI